MEYILRTNTVSKKYTNYYAVDKVSISIKKGEIYGLIGENGAGKSTLMKMIAGLVEPSEGSIELFGNFVPQTERYRIGCVIESPALYAELTAKQNLEVFRKAYGLSSKESVQQILKQVGLSQYENKIVKKFSLGMKQRLAIGVALLGNPDFLILDEPINGLDPTGIQDMRNFLLKLNREEHITIDKLYDKFTDLEKKEFLNSFVEQVDIYEQEQPDGRFLKHIKFRFPVYFGDRETQELCWDNESTVESCALLSKLE